LTGLTLLFDVGAICLAVCLLSARETTSSSPERRIAVPYETNRDLWEPYRRWVVQEDGRAKPFDTFCRESVRAITGRERCEMVRSPITGHVLIEGHDSVAVVVSWLLLDEPDPERAREKARRMECDWEHHPFILCAHRDLHRLLDEESRQGNAVSAEENSSSYVAPAVLRKSAELAELLHQVTMKKHRDPRAPLTALESAAVEVKGRLDLYDRIRSGGEIEDGHGNPRASGDCRIVALDRAGASWFSLRSLRTFAAAPDTWETAWKARRLEDAGESEEGSSQPFPAAEAEEILAAFMALRDAYRSGEAPHFATASTGFFATLERVSGRFGTYPDADSMERELWYNRVNPFRKAWLAGLPAALLLAGSLLLGRRRIVGRALYVGGLLACAGSAAWAIAGFYCRVSISGRPPVSNMYESLVWVALMTAVLGLVLELIYRRGAIALAASLVGTLGFVLADQLPLTFSPSIQPLQAVLRSNYWLVIHVLTIVSSYAPFALAWGLGNLNLALILYAPQRRDLIQALSGYCYRAIQVGVLLLFLGTMLGGFWAAESWGRFWGWDPKEVWALVALLCYLIPLHARYAGWLRDFGLAVCSVACFASVVMAWYGVNFVLGVGLHSYGFGSGNNSWIYLAGLTNISLVFHAALRRSSRTVQATVVSK
jgi:ABC-type transport system involved in cytochrome c biogenesis permease subunit